MRRKVLSLVAISMLSSTMVHAACQELFISEYIEGSSNNKAIEIYNGTGSNVDMGDYKLEKATNGSNSFGSTTMLSGTLSDGDVYVIVHSLADSTITDQLNMGTNTAIMTFNGNDTIRLLHDNQEIDRIGTANSDTDFAKDITLVREEGVTQGVTTNNNPQTNSEWIVHPKDTFSFLGSHTATGCSGTTEPTEDPSLRSEAMLRFPPVLNDFNITDSSGNVITDKVLNTNTTYTFNWKVLGYNEDYISHVAIFDCENNESNCGARYSYPKILDSDPSDENTTNTTDGPWIYENSDATKYATSQEFTFTTDFTPTQEAGNVVLRFYVNSSEEINAGFKSKSLIVKGGMDNVEYYDAEGRRLQLEIQ